MNQQASLNAVANTAWRLPNAPYHRPKLYIDSLCPSLAFTADTQWLAGAIPFCRPNVPRVEAPPGARPIVILPGFGNKTQDYVAPFGDEQASLCAALRARGFRTYVVPCRRKDWLRVARSLLTLRYWRTRSTTHPGYTWYLQRVAETVDRARLECGADRVDLIGHSAGGWLARAFLGRAHELEGGQPAVLGSLGSLGGSEGSLSLSDSDEFALGSSAWTAAPVWAPHEGVASIVSLGTPHLPAPADKVRDMTGGALAWVNATWPEAAYASSHDVAYVAVAGRAVVGDQAADRQALAGYSHDSYKQVCGEGHGIEGDAVVPLVSALPPGWRHVVLDGVLHSMSRVRTFNEPSGTVWYGSEEVLDTWLAELVAAGYN